MSETEIRMRLRLQLVVVLGVVAVVLLAMLTLSNTAPQLSVAPADGGPIADVILQSGDDPEPTVEDSVSAVPAPDAVDPVPEPMSFVSGLEVMVDPARPEPAASVSIAAKVASDSATLLYRVGFDTAVSVDMLVDNGIAAATIPGQQAGTLVRYRIDTGEESAPAFDDTIEYLGYVVTDPSQSSPLPRIDWFMDPAEFDDMITNHLLDNQMFPTTIAYNGVVYDNVMVRPRGGEYRRTNFPKQSFEFEFPKGHDFIAPELVPYPIDQFAMGSQFGDWTMGREYASWSIFNDETGRPVHSAQTMLAQNGDFYGVYRFSEKLDGEWREAVGLDGGAFYKANGVGGWRAPRNGWDVKSPKEGTSDEIDAVGTRLRDDPSGPAKTAFLYETFDIPNVINHMALTALVDHDDQTFQNFFVYHDTEGSGLYSLHPWDLDETFGPNTLCWEQPMADLGCMQDPLFDSVMAVPELEAMYWQRVRTLVDKQLAGNLIEDRHAAMIATVGELADQEAQRWGRNAAYTMSDIFNDAVDVRRWVFDNDSRMVPAQPETPAIVINEILASPNEGEAEILELYNASGSPVDLSGWAVDGVDLVIPGGTVILPGAYVVLTDSVALVRSSIRNKNTLVIGFDGGLNSDGETLILSNANGIVVDEVTYKIEAPWPSPAVGSSLELVNADADNSQPDAWGPSQAFRGTPGEPNQS